MEMVRKAGTALLMSFQSMCAALIIMSEPVRISAGPVQYTGMEAAQHTRLFFDRLPSCRDTPALSSSHLTAKVITLAPYSSKPLLYAALGDLQLFKTGGAASSQTA